MSEDESIQILERVLNSANERTKSCKLLIKGDEVDFFCPSDTPPSERKEDLDNLIRGLRRKTVFDRGASEKKNDILRILRAKRKEEKEEVSYKSF